MECPKELRQCPNGWNDCECCAHQRACIAGMYEPEEDSIEIVIKAAKVAEKVVDAEARESAEKVRGTWYEHFISLGPDEALKEFYKFKQPGLHHKEPVPAGEASPGGGSKNGIKVEKKGTKKTVYEWGMFK